MKRLTITNMDDDLFDQFTEACRDLKITKTNLLKELIKYFLLRYHRGDFDEK
jgi:hypothetical protein